MKIKLILIGVCVSLMCMKCPEENLLVSFENKSNEDVVLSCTNDSDSLKKIIQNKFHHDCRFKHLQKNNVTKDTLVESDLHFYSGMKNRDYYTFYFFPVVKFDTVANKYIFDTEYDSINIDKEKIRIGVNVYNVFEYDDKKIVFKVSK
ncbi:hypothetical protein [Flavobacterium sp. RSSB_23]|uniref:hypothetical protein n=1 Tax=Flavobacterium sp. RSSB_23 TaxID=3447668 RepID=UPI003F2FDBEF